MSGNNNTTITNNVDKKNNFENKVTHPCVHCSKPCFGSQCKECHLKMVANREGECVDCKNNFYALRKDGSKRKRCQECQERYNKDHTDICPDCGNVYHARLDDGRVFNRCFDCYTKSFHKCAKCDNTIRGDFEMCSECFNKEKQVEFENKRRKIETLHPLVYCRNKDCHNKTTFTYCKPCNDNIRSLEYNYMLSTCQEEGCGYKGRGNFKYCSDHIVRA